MDYNSPSDYCKSHNTTAIPNRSRSVNAKAKELKSVQADTYES